eukprot:m.19868 g.19868  ORF g.19868 m.19868 type:complete len:495 (+) comp5181_c0_seq1:69-1553(+)
MSSEEMNTREDDNLPNDEETMDTCEDQQETLDPKELALAEKEEGNAMYKQKKYYEALAHYTKAIGFDPDMPTYYHNRSAAYIQIGKYKEGLEDAHKSLSLDPSQAKYHNRIAKCYVGLGRFSDARRHYASASQLPGGSKTAEQELKGIDTIERLLRDAKTAESANHFNNAVSLVEQAMKFAPFCDALRMEKARYLLKAGDVGTSSRIASDILRENALHPDALCLRGQCLLKLGNVDQAIAHFRRALTSNPDHSDCKTLFKSTKQLLREKERGNEAFKSGKLEEAIHIYTEALQLNPDCDIFNAKIHFNLALTKSKLGDIDGAVKQCQRAVALDPSYEKARLKVPQLYMEAEMYEEAVQAYEEMVQGDPQNRNLRQELRNAKLELKKSKRKDYYKILGVNKSANETDIKRAYKKSALKCHPDRVSAEEKDVAEAKFKELGEAYGVLSDPEKKTRYDNGEDLDDMQRGGGFSNVDVNDIFSQVFGGGGGFNFGFRH